MQLVRSWTVSRTPHPTLEGRHSFTQFFATHKKASLISSFALLVALSAAAIGWGTQPTGASSAGDTMKGVSVKVHSSSDQTPPSQPAEAAGTQNTSSGSTQTNVTQTSTNGSTNTQVQVNGQNIPVPQNGSVEQTVPGNDNQSDVHITINNQSSGSSTSSNITQITSSSSSSVEGGTPVQ